MKKFLLKMGLLTMAAFSTVAFADAEIQIFFNYRGYNDYDAKQVSTWTNVVSAAAVYVAPGEVPTNGACFMGDPQEALNLFAAMVDVYNQETGRAIVIDGYPYNDAASAKVALTIDEINESGQRVPWFPRLRQCDRWSTPDERLSRVD